MPAERRRALYYVMCFDRMDPARCSAVAVIQPFRSFCLPGTCAWIAAGPTLRGLPCDARPICPLSAGYVGADLCVSMVCETPCVRRGLIGPGGYRYSHIVKCQRPSFQLSQFYPSPKLGQLFYPAEMSVNTLSVNALSVKADAAGAASQICKHPPYPLSNCGVCP